MEKTFVVRKVATQLCKTEAALDEAVLETTDLLRDCMQARRDLGANSLFANDVHVKLMAAMQALTEARTARHDVHGGLKEAGLRLGLRNAMATTMDGIQTISGRALVEDLRMSEEDARKAG